VVRLGMITNKIDYKVYSNKPFAIWANSRIINERLSANSYNRDYLDFAKAKNTFNFKKVSDIAKVTAMIGWKGLTTDDYVDEDGVYLLRTVDIKDNYIDLENAVMAKREKVYEQPQIILKQGDIIFSKDGTLGITAIVPRHQNKEMCVGSTLARIRLNSNLDNYYVCAAFMSKIVQAQIGYFTSGIAQPHITQEYINKLEIPIPSPEIQKYIGDKVRKAEELREEAKRLKKEAEEILNAELKLSYFNERVKDAPKIYNWIYGESIEIRIDSQYYINETNFINNEMYKKGLKLKRISEIANVGKGFSYTSLDNKSIPYIRISDLDDLLINFDTAELVDEKTYSEKKSSQLEKYDLIFAITGATIGKVSLFYNSKYSKATLSSDTAFVRLKDKNDAAYVLLYLKSFIGQLGILKGVTGATNRHLSLEHIGDIFIPVIDNKLKQEINMRVIKAIDNVYLSKQLIKEAKQDVEDLIEGNFDMSKVKANS